MLHPLASNETGSVVLFLPRRSHPNPTAVGSETTSLFASVAPVLLPSQAWLSGKRTPDTRP